MSADAPGEPAAGDDAAGPEQLYLAVRECANREEAERFALVLASVGIPSLIAAGRRRTLLLVRASQAASARAQLDAYVEENRAPPAPGRSLLPPGSGQTGLLVAVAAVLFVEAAAGRHLFGLDWWAAGTAQAGRIVAGEWWRAVTALFLHVGLDHLAGNLLFGAVFALLLSRQLAAGPTWLAILLGGTAGNLANAWLRAPDHASVGASTAVFAAIGLLSVLSWRLPVEADRRGLRRIAPLGGGVLLLAYLGFSGERTDIGAHLLGFAAGSIEGALLAAGWRWVPQSAAVRTASGAAAAAIAALAWSLALRTGG